MKKYHLFYFVVIILLINVYRVNSLDTIKTLEFNTSQGNFITSYWIFNQYSSAQVPVITAQPKDVRAWNDVTDHTALSFADAGYSAVEDVTMIGYSSTNIPGYGNIIYLQILNLTTLNYKSIISINHSWYTYTSSTSNTDNVNVWWWNNSKSTSAYTLSMNRYNHGENGQANYSANITNDKITMDDVINSSKYVHLLMQIYSSSGGTDNAGFDFMKLIITYTTDGTEPGFSDFEINNSSPKTGDDVQINTTLHDDENGQSWFFSWNDTENTFINVSNGTWTGTSQKISVDHTIQGKHSSNISYYWSANDTNNNMNTSLPNYIFVSNSKPNVPIISTPSTGSHNSSNWTLINWSGTDPDNEPLTYYLWMNSSQGYTLNISTTQTGVNLTNLADGKYWIKLQSDDGYDNSPNSTEQYFVIDTQSPTIKIITPKDKSINNSEWINYTIQFNDNIGLLDTQVIVLNNSGNVIYNLTNKSINTANHTLSEMFNWTNQADGNFTIIATATDDISNSPKISLEIEKSKKESTNYQESTITDGKNFFHRKVGIVDILEKSISITGKNVSYKDIYQYENQEPVHIKSTYCAYLEPGQGIIVLTSFPQGYEDRSTITKIPGHITSQGYYWHSGDAEKEGWQVLTRPLGITTIAIIYTKILEEPSMECVDPLIGGLHQTSKNITITKDTTGPTINLLSPGDPSTNTTTTTIDWSYTVSDENNIDTCKLWLNGNLKSTDTSITQGVNHFNIQEANIGGYNWNISCTDLSQNNAWSETNGITITSPPPTPPTAAGGGGTTTIINNGTAESIIKFDPPLIDFLVIYTPKKALQEILLKNVGNVPITEGTIIITDGVKEWINASFCDITTKNCKEKVTLTKDEEAILLINASFTENIGTGKVGQIRIEEPGKAHTITVTIDRPPGFEFYKWLSTRFNLTEQQGAITFFIMIMLIIGIAAIYLPTTL